MLKPWRRKNVLTNFKLLPIWLIPFLPLIRLLTISNLTASSRYEDFFPQLNSYFSEKPLGANFENGQTMFRLFAPTATAVKLVIFDQYSATSGTEHLMKKDKDGVWELGLAGKLLGRYYGYKINGKQDRYSFFDPNMVVADPYSKAVVSLNSYQHPAKSIIIDTNYDWEGDAWSTIPLQDLIIYEMHVRDLTAHPSSGADQPGTYAGVIETGKTGGLDYLLNLGVNAVELLPCQEFGNIEIPFKDKNAPVYNTWNPYARNHWGYMTSYFFAPESYYASAGNLEPGNYCGIHGQQVRDFKALVKTLHQNGIAVIMDVVYNHVSQYDFNPFKYIDKKYYFRLDKKGNFLSKSGCGNDFMSERPMARRLIVESLNYWMTEYHIDGFRFDLAYLLDEETCRQILAETRKINPNVYLIAEPWGDGYAPDYFSRLGWAAWNDKFRNGVKGQNPLNNLGFIFGHWERENQPENLKRYVLGSTTADGGLFQQSQHSVNYLESHDDYTFGDFVRIGTKAVSDSTKIKDLASHVRLNPQQLKICKLGALFLFVSQGATMMHQGQEFARSKVIAATTAPDRHQGQIDHNSYNKDNETNWINYQHREINRELYDYYQGLIQLRKDYPALRKSPRESYRFLKCANPFGFGFRIDKKISGSKKNIVVLMNGDPSRPVEFKLPAGQWSLIVNNEKAGTSILKNNLSGKIKIPETSGMVLIQ